MSDQNLMSAIAVEQYGGPEKLLAKRVAKPVPGTNDVLVRIKACSVNPIDIKVRKQVYDDFPNYYDHVPNDDYQVLGYDGAGVIESIAYEALVERMEIKTGENAGILIVNGGGGVGSVASQIARTILKLPVVITTASRADTIRFSQSMGATHVINHRGDLPSQVEQLRVNVPIKYISLTHSTADYLPPAAKICAPFGKICSIVQTAEFSQYGTEMMGKSLSFVWELIGTKPWYHVAVASHGRILEELRQLVEDGTVRCHHVQSLALDVEGLRKAHKTIERGGNLGKIGLGVDLTQRPFS